MSTFYWFILAFWAIFLPAYFGVLGRRASSEFPVTTVWVATLAAISICWPLVASAAQR
jgi:hypothetical protein